MTTKILFFWCCELIIVIYNVWNKTPESILRFHEASVALNKFLLGVWQARRQDFAARGARNHKGANF